MRFFNHISDCVPYECFLQSNKGFFKRGDLAEKEREEYERRHNIQRVDANEEKKRRISLTDTLAGIGPDKGKLPMTLSRQEVEFSSKFSFNGNEWR